jgi:nucleotide-binding universal stress UspA family protein
MYKHILIATDGSDLANKAVTTGLELAKKLEAKVTVVTATEPYTAMVGGEVPALGFPIEDYDAASSESASRILAAASGAAHSMKVACTAVHAKDFPAEAIIDTAKTRGCDLIVMASHGRHGISAIVLGSETVKVLTHCKIPVLVHR